MHGIGPAGQMVLTNRSPRVDRARLPLRGDLAHIRLAGSWFVSHYAAPLRAHVGNTGAILLPAPRADGEPLAWLVAGTAFDMLDVAGDWAWGQVDEELGEAGLVGYIDIAGLERL